MLEFLIQIQPQQQLQQATTKQGTDGDDNIVLKNGEFGIVESGKGNDVITVENGAFYDLTGDADKVFDADDSTFSEGNYDKIKVDLKPNQKLYLYNSHETTGFNTEARYLGIVDENMKVISGIKFSAGNTFHTKSILTINNDPAYIHELSELGDKLKHTNSNVIAKSFTGEIDSGILAGEARKVKDALKTFFDNEKIEEEIIKNSKEATNEANKARGRN